MNFKLSSLLLVSFFIFLQTTSKSQNDPKDYLSNCLMGKIKYPWRFQLMKVEGRVLVELKTNENGYIDKINVKADYFGKSNIYMPFTDSTKIENLRIFVSKKIIPVITNCVKNHQFSQINYNFVIPVSFGLYGFEDDYTIYDDEDYEYDYQEQFDYQHEYD